VIRVSVAVKPDSPSISIALPLPIAAADESRDELRSIWARLLAAAADPARAKSFRVQFIEVAKQMDPLDAAVLDTTHRRQGVTAGLANELAIEFKVNRDEVEISLDNLARFGSWRLIIRAFFTFQLLAVNFCARFPISAYDDRLLFVGNCFLDPIMLSSHLGEYFQV
jgi:Abortive infection alpha